MQWVSDDYTGKWHVDRAARGWGGWDYPTGSQYLPGIVFDWLHDFLKLYFARTIFRANSSFSWWAATLSPTAKVFSPVVDKRHIYGVDGIEEIDVEFVEGNHPHWLYGGQYAKPEIGWANERWPSLAATPAPGRWRLETRRLGEGRRRPTRRSWRSCGRRSARRKRQTPASSRPAIGRGSKRSRPTMPSSRSCTGRWSPGRTPCRGPSFGACGSGTERPCSVTARSRISRPTSVVACPAASVACILLKGAALVRTLYADPGLRHVGDLDLLVDERDVPRAASLLDVMGFRRFGRPLRTEWPTCEFAPRVRSRRSRLDSRRAALEAVRGLPAVRVRALRGQGAGAARRGVCPWACSRCLPSTSWRTSASISSGTRSSIGR